MVLPDQELLNYLNTWDEQHRHKDDWLIEIDISALANEFQMLFKGQIAENPERLDYWLSHHEEIARPIYVAAMVKAMQDLVKDQNFGNLDRWMNFCSWVLSHADQERVEGQPEPSDESIENPDWRSSRRAVVDFIESCLKKEVDAPITARDGLDTLLQLACTQFDWRLDRDQPVLLKRDDPVTEAINNTRSRALDALFDFGFWIRRHAPQDSVPEVRAILSNRISREAQYPLTRPESALLGMKFRALCALDLEWAKEHREILFPQTNEAVWRDAFSSYIRFNSPIKVIFEILREDFEFAIQHINDFLDSAESEREIVGRLGQHLFSYFLWQLYTLDGDDSLLARYYEATNKDRQRWAHLFDHVGRSLNNSEKDLEKGLVNRSMAYFDWRREAAESQELQQFTYWLSAECLDPEWRLKSYSKILDLLQTKGIGAAIEVKTLNTMLNEHLQLVVECFRKITDTLREGSRFYVSADEIKPILKAGLSSGHPEIRKDAEAARENLLRFGRFDLMDMD